MPEALRRLDLESLIGLSVEQARAQVEEAGGEFRAVVPFQMVRLSYRPGRVTVVTDDDRAMMVGIRDRGRPTTR